jgi:hypothetical protein
MKLYHFTTADNVLPVKERGLLPQLDEVMTAGRPVVWLTTQPDVSLEPQAAKRLARLGFYEAPAGLQKARAREAEGLDEGVTAGLCRQWSYGSKGERLTMQINGRECTVTFSTPDDDLMRLTVQVADDDPNLHHYVTWPERARNHLATTLYRQPHVRLWYVYTGSIGPRAITDVTPVQSNIEAA